mmetsp:Transcript_13272/g.24906  ORF Transcript_13272/g.24906 Transcript_13272/m.24906 type:complete len:418 (-) Transcript_13272:93-1346(-)
MDSPKNEFRIRAVTAFISFTTDDFQEPQHILGQKIQKYASFLRTVENMLSSAGYEVQTLRIAANPFGDYLSPASNPTQLHQQLHLLDETLKSNCIDFFAMGPARTPIELECCPVIVSTSRRLSCSADLGIEGTAMAKKTAECIKSISQITGDSPHCKNGLGNFQFCATACCKAYIPFFPAARALSLSEQQAESASSSDQDVISFAIGLENGSLARRLLMESKSVENISSVFRLGMAAALAPLSAICQSFADKSQGTVKFVGIDTSLNPSLEEGGSVAAAIEQIDIVDRFGGRGSIAVTAEITKALKSLPGIVHVGYSGLMLPVMEDNRLAELATSGHVDTTRLLALSSVCGVGLDTVPIPGDSSHVEILSLLLDVRSLAVRYNKSLSCRLFLCPGLQSGEKASIESPYLCDCNVLHL